ncbi:MAG: outer membrane protein assembly factor BamD [Gammaproteobacteria bacterium]|nr:outer membrane protein assembly factor BamD [Gammaproteobacteria bacterium]
MAITIRLSILLFALLLISGCSMLPDLEDETKGWSAQQFYNEASSAMADGNYENAIKYYEGLESRYPFGRLAMQSQLDIAYAYYKDNKPEAAVAAADRFIKLHPRNPHVDYAYYLRGIVNFNRNLGFIARYVPIDTSQRDPGSVKNSFDYLNELVTRFPDSKYSNDARRRMIYLRNNLAMHEIHVARYYLKRGAYVAAAKRAVTVVENYQRTPAVQDALEIMIVAYDKLGMEELYKDTVRVLALNESKGNFDIPGTDQEKSLSKQAWDFMELDQN